MNIYALTELQRRIAERVAALSAGGRARGRDDNFHLYGPHPQRGDPGPSDRRSFAVHVPVARPIVREEFARVPSAWRRSGAPDGGARTWRRETQNPATLASSVSPFESRRALTCHQHLGRSSPTNRSTGFFIRLSPDYSTGVPIRRWCASSFHQPTVTMALTPHAGR